MEKEKKKYEEKIDIESLLKPFGDIIMQNNNSIRIINEFKFSKDKSKESLLNKKNKCFDEVFLKRLKYFISQNREYLEKIEFDLYCFNHFLMDEDIEKKKCKK
jgi:hypothetical protein